MKGEFEKRLRQVIDEVESSPKPIILFIDEAHTLIGAGGQAGTGDAANLLKPALARGRLRTIAATTWAEYRQYFEKDPALTRRFQTVNVGEPETDKAIAMIRSVAPMMEKHHGVIVLDEAVEAAVKLSQRYVPARQLPDKGVSLLDTACARVAVSQHATPAQVEDRKRKVELLEVEIEIAQREVEGRYGPASRVEKLKEILELARADAAEIVAKWDREKAALEKARAARAAFQVVSSEGTSPEAAAALATDDAPTLGSEGAVLEPVIVAAPVDRASALAQLDEALAAMREAQGDAHGLRRGRFRCGGRRGRRLDRHPDRPDGQGRDCPASSPSPTSSRHASSARITPWMRSPSASRPAAPSSTIPTSRSACSCCAAPRASARPRPRTCCRNCSTRATIR
jgi:ATP-dependent Clp protease ATP-binding subunit ClpA